MDWLYQNDPYEVIFGGKILNDEVYDTEDGFARIWTVQTDKGCDRVHFIAPAVRSKDNNSWFIVESNPRLKLKSIPQFEDLSACSTSMKIISQGCQRGIKRFLDLGWNLLATQTFDLKKSVSPTIIHQECEKYGAGFKMTREWILVHPTQKIILSLQIYVDQDNKCGKDDNSPVWSTWGWRMRTGRIKIKGEDKIWCDEHGFSHAESDFPSTLGDYIIQSFGDMINPPDERFANLLNEVNHTDLPFKNLNEKWISSGKITPELEEKLKKITILYDM